MLRALAAGVLVAAGLVLGAADAAAHAGLVSSEPADGATVATAPGTLTLEFTEPPDLALTVVRVLESSGAAAQAGRPAAIAGVPLRVQVPLELEGEGVYTVTWRTVSKVDGHATAGTLAFGVGRAVEPVSAPGSGYTAPTAFATASRWLLLAGLALAIGAGWVGVLLFSPAPRVLYALASVGVAAGLAGVAGLAESQRRAAGVTLRAVVSTSIGHTLVARAAPLAVAVAALGVGAVADGRLRRRALGATALAAAASVAAHVAAGHAGAARPWLVATAFQWTHVVAFCIWIGGLVGLLAAARGEPDAVKARAVRGYSRVAAIVLLLVAATGTVRAVAEVGSWRALVTTGFGRVVLAKVALLAGLASLGGVNRWRSVPAAATTLRPLRRVGSAELALAVAVVGLSSLLAGFAPPASAPRSSTGRVVARGADFATTVRARLDVAPGLPGPNRYSLELRDYDSGDPVDADRVTLRITRDASTAATAELRRAGPGRWTGAGSQLSLEGTWRVVALVQRGVDSTEVPMSVELRAVPQRVQVVRAPGQPDLYTIEIGAGRSVQAYVDPGRAGPNEVHATFFDGGSELPLTGLAIRASGPGGTRVLDARRLTPGHFVADAELARGRWRFTVEATTETGAGLRARFTTQVDGT